MPDISNTLAPKSDQANAEDFLGGPRTFTVKEVRVVNGEQPVHIVLAEFPAGRPFKPALSMRRVLVAAWGKESDGWIGRRMTLFRDAQVTFGPDTPGGIRISHLSHIAEPIELWLTVKRGKRAPFRVQPLPESAPTSPALDELTVARLADLRAEWEDASPERRAEIKAEVARLQGGQS